MAHPLTDAKQAFSSAIRAELVLGFRALLDDHPVMGRLPERDRQNAAENATTHALLSIRARSISELL